jgi:hypothetical protein
MKTITNLITAATVVAVTLFSAKANAQVAPLGQVNFNVGVMGGLPTYDARTLSGAMAGATGRFEVGLGDYLSVTAASGYYNLFDKTSTINGASVQEPGLGIIPMKFGLRGNLGNSGVYLIGEAGAGFETSTDNATGSKDVKGLLSGGIGYNYHGLDYSINYDSFSGQSFNYGILSLRIAYGFKL